MKKLSLVILLAISSQVYAEGEQNSEATAAPAETAAVSEAAPAAEATPAEASVAEESAPAETAAAEQTPVAETKPAAEGPIVGDIAAGQTKGAVCAGCHGVDGNSPAPIFPKTAGQHAEYIISQLQAFKSGERVEPQMVPFVAALTGQDMADLAAYFSSQKVQPGTANDPEGKGEKLYYGGNTATGVSACAACHGPKGGGNPGANYPSLKGQHGEYVKKQLIAFKTGTRAASANAQLMADIAKRMSDEEIAAVSAYIPGLQ
jgi:cytochrome c553